MCDFQNITFVVQGHFIDEPRFSTTRTLRSINKYYPTAPIILSTWEMPEEEKLLGIRNLTVCINEDPGPLNTKNSYLKNLNRMIVSTRNGIIQADTKYVAKVRSDFEFVGPLELTDSLKNSIKRGKILMCISRGHYPLLPYFISDWFNLGSIEQMRALWDVKLVSNKDLDPFLRKTPSVFSTTDAINSQDFEYHSEQWLGYNFINQKHKLTRIKDFENLPGLVRSYLYLDQYFCCISRWDTNLRSEKHLVVKKFGDTLLWKSISCVNQKILKTITLYVVLFSYIMMMKLYYNRNV